jgi:hypothetical protein
MLTSEEKAAVMACRYFGDYWGEKPEDGLCPVATVAQLRGTRFDYREETQHFSVRVGDTFSVVDDARDDICEWLGINQHAESFYDVLKREREKILARAPKE